MSLLSYTINSGLWYNQILIDGDIISLTEMYTFVVLYLSLTPSADSHHKVSALRFSARCAPFSITSSSVPTVQTSSTFLCSPFLVHLDSSLLLHHHLLPLVTSYVSCFVLVSGKKGFSQWEPGAFSRSLSLHMCLSQFDRDLNKLCGDDTTALN